jgi:hypothetical protein
MHYLPGFVMIPVIHNLPEVMTSLRMTHLMFKWFLVFMNDIMMIHGFYDSPVAMMVSGVHDSLTSL